MIAVIHERIVT